METTNASLEHEPANVALTMTAMLDRLSEVYADIVKTGDPRGNKLPLVSTPTVTMVTIGLYISFTKYAPRFFQDKKPLGIKPLIVVYNLFMVLFSAYMFKEFLISAYLIGYDMVCQPKNTPLSLGPVSTRMVRVCWLFYISKIIELADTVFLVVRKKGQLSFLHVFHHSTVVFDQWTFVKFFPSSQAFFQAVCNCFVHTIMYLYYFLACFPALKQYLWWKKYLTMLQMIQFVLVISHGISVLYTGCDIPRWAIYLCLGECTILLGLFANYYIQTYLKKRQANLKRLNKSE